MRVRSQGLEVWDVGSGLKVMVQGVGALLRLRTRRMPSHSEG